MADAGDARLEDVNRRLADEGYPPIRKLPADEAALAAWRRFVDAKRELDSTGKISPAVLVAIGQFCHCYKCPTYPRGERAVYCLSGKSEAPFVKTTCLCPSCEVYQMGAMHGDDYFCETGVPAKRLLEVGGAVGAARRFMQMEHDKGNPGKRLPERLMAPPQLVGRTQDEVDVPEKVPGA